MAAIPRSYIEKVTSVTVTDNTQPLPSIAFNVAIVADVVYGSAAGDVKEYPAATAVATAAVDLAASDITQIVYDQIVAIFAQEQVPEQVTLIKKGAGTYAAAIAAAEVDGYRAPWSFTYVIIDSRADASIVDASDACETRDCLFLAQSDEAGWLTSGVPSGFSTIVDNAKTFVIYEDTDATAVDGMWVGRIAGTKVNSERQSGKVKLINLPAYAAELTATQEAFADANKVAYHKVTTPGGSTRNVVNAVALTGRRFSLSLAMLWTKVRLIEGLGEVITRKAATGAELVDDEASRQEILAAIDVKMQIAKVPPYIGPSAAYPRSYAINSLTITGSAASVSLTANFLTGVETIAVAVSLT